MPAPRWSSSIRGAPRSRPVPTCTSPCDPAPMACWRWRSPRCCNATGTSIRRSSSKWVDGADEYLAACAGVDGGSCRRGLRRRRLPTSSSSRRCTAPSARRCCVSAGVRSETATVARPVAPCSRCRRWPASSACPAPASSTRSTAAPATRQSAVRRGVVGDAPVPDRRAINMNRLGRILTDDEGGRVEVLFVQGSNPAATCPEQAIVLQGLAREDLFTVVHDLTMTDTAQLRRSRACRPPRSSRSTRSSAATARS